MSDDNVAVMYSAMLAAMVAGDREVAIDFATKLQKRLIHGPVHEVRAELGTMEGAELERLHRMISKISRAGAHEVALELARRDPDSDMARAAIAGDKAGEVIGKAFIWIIILGGGFLLGALVVSAL